MVKLVRYFWKLQGKPDKQIMIGRTYAYHGVTLAAASLSGLPNMHPQFALPLPGFMHVPAPYWYAEGGEFTPSSTGSGRQRPWRGRSWSSGRGRSARSSGSRCRAPAA